MAGSDSIRVGLYCHGCHRWSLRRVRRQRDSGRYCSKNCHGRIRTLVSQERLTLLAIARNWKPITSPVVKAEIAALRRIARWTPNKIRTVRPCRACGSKVLGIGNRYRICAGCKAETRKVAAVRKRKSAAGKASKRVYKARRRALECGAQADRIDPLKVFDRDGWRCHMCGSKTPKALRGTYEPRAPELDHVVPLGAGGAHTWGNVKCCCRQCNIKKADKPIGQIGFDMAA